MDGVTYDLLPKATVRISDGAEFTREILTGADGKMMLCLPIDNNYRITVDRPGYKPRKFTVSTSNLTADKDTFILAELMKGSSYQLAGRVVNDETDSIISGARIKIGTGSGIPEVSESDNEGNFWMSLEPG